MRKKKIVMQDSQAEPSSNFKIPIQTKLLAVRSMVPFFMNKLKYKPLSLDEVMNPTIITISCF